MIPAMIKMSPIWNGFQLGRHIGSMSDQLDSSRPFNVEAPLAKGEVPLLRNCKDLRCHRFAALNVWPEMAHTKSTRYPSPPRKEAVRKSRDKQIRRPRASGDPEPAPDLIRGVSD